ncbi:hypothetical protein BGZ95_010839 [Linnemannia exigua]|uniref:Uncharacterized protein n=1 Tax=Linnemannia exigua TaxID=604196 RepID=A0AAD4DK46_9FUNG|nr:hypothetical protein BGZ95_010839 [Linnemannia exigua]
MNALKTLVYNNPGLRRWSLCQPVPQLTSNVWRAIAAPTEALASEDENTTTITTATNTISAQLDVLDVTNTTIDYESIPFFIAACRATKILKITSCNLEGLRNPHTNQLRAPPGLGHGDDDDDGPYVPQTVHFNDIVGISVLSQLEFLTRCPDVREIHWQSTKRSENGMKFYQLLVRRNGLPLNQPLPTMDDFWRLVQSKTWMHLRSLVVSGIYALYKNRILEFIPDEGFAHILESIPAQQLVKLECKGTAFGPLGLQALKRHCESLEMLVVKWSSNFTSALGQEALESFPKVTCLQVERLAFEDIERGGPWVCLGLKVLQVQFDMGVVAGLEDEQRRHRLVFDRISALVLLKRLTLNAEDAGRAPRLQFSTSYGLGALSTLTNLSILDVFESEQRLEMADVVWMVENWPKLHTVEGDLHPDNHKDRVLKEYLHSHF